LVGKVEEDPIIINDASPGRSEEHQDWATGQLDYRVDLSQGLDMFTCLQRMGLPSEPVNFPDEGHSVGKLENLRFVYGEQFNWPPRWFK
jgi:hypothetical protein